MTEEIKSIEEVEVPNVVDVVEVDESGEVGLTPEELEMAEKYGIAVKGEEEKEEEVKETEEVKEDKKEPTFEEMDDALSNRPDEFHKNFDSNSKALYFKQKKYKQRAQEAEAEKELLQVQLKAMRDEIDGLKAKPKDDDDIFSDEEEKPLTKADLEKIEAKKLEEAKAKDAEIKARASKIKEHMDLQYAEAKSKYDDFEDVMVMAKEVLEKGLIPKDLPVTVEEIHGKYKQKIINGDDDIAEFAYRIGKLHPDFGKVKEDSTDEEKEEAKPKNKDIEKIIANAGKPKSSANLGGGAGVTRKVSVDDLTIEDVRHFTTEQYRALPKKVRERLLAS